MKKNIIIGGCVAFLIFAGWWVAGQANLFAYKGMILEELPSDVAKFYGDNKRLPLSWEEFASWAEKAHTNRHWTAEELNSLFALKWGAQVTSRDPRDEKILFTLDPKLKNIEPYVNGRLHDLCIMSLPSGSQ